MGRYFFWLAGMGSSFLLYLWPVTLGLAIWAALSWYSTLRRRPDTVVRDVLWSISPLVGTLVILVLGCVLVREGWNAANWPWAEFFLQLLWSLVLVTLGRGTRPLFAAMFTLELWVSYWMAAVAAMSISDKWI